MGLFKKTCTYCNKKIDRGSEVSRDVKDPVFIGTKEKNFCCEGHADAYVEGSANAEACGSGGGCCG